MSGCRCTDTVCVRVQVYIDTVCVRVVLGLTEVWMSCLLLRFVKRETRDMFGGDRYGVGEGVPLWACAEASLPLEVPAT